MLTKLCQLLRHSRMPSSLRSPVGAGKGKLGAVPSLSEASVSPGASGKRLSQSDLSVLEAEDAAPWEARAVKLRETTDTV